MPTYDEYRNAIERSYSSSDARLEFLRGEATRSLSSLRGYSLLIKMLVEERGTPQMPPDFLGFCQTLLDKAEELNDLIDAVTLKEHRDILRAKHENARQAEYDKAWIEAQTELEDLRGFPNLIDAVQTTSLKKNLTLPADINIALSWHPYHAVFVFNERHINVIPHLKCRSQDGPFGYHITLRERDSDGIQKKELSYEGITNKIEEVAFVVYEWLVEKWEVQRIGEKHEFMRRGSVEWYPYRPLNSGAKQ